MAVQLQITVRDMPHSEALELRIRQKMAGLQRLNDRIVACKVVVEAPHHHHARGAHYRVSLNIKLPDGEIVANRDHARDIYIALRDAFLSARRQLLTHLERKNGGDKIARSAGRRAASSGAARNG